MRRLARAIAATAVLLGVPACASTVEPRAGTTLLVWNASCLTGPCPTLHVLGYPENQPNTPGGYWHLDLGVINGPEACLSIPSSAVFRVIGLYDNGTADTVTTTWTPAIPLSLGTLAPNEDPFLSGPSSDPFTPAASRGWELRLPEATQVVPAAPCGP